jgi:ABC-type branched-subunit amino acid transport system ATPase component
LNSQRFLATSKMRVQQGNGRVTSMTTPLLEVRDLRAGYGAIEVVHGVDLKVHAGEVVALLGSNGAGKTTTLLTCSGELPPIAGEIRWEGEQTRSPLHARARGGLGLITEQRAIFMTLSVADNLRVCRGDADFALEMFPELRPRLKLRAGNLSGGEQQMLALACALCRKPKLLLADELSIGLAPLVVNRLLEAVRKSAEANIGVLLIEQHVRKVMQYVDRIYVMSRGKIEMSGTAAEFQPQLEKIEASYLSGLPPTDD